MPHRPSPLANWWLLSRSLATALVQVERTRRQLLFGLTLFLLLAVFVGAMPLADRLGARPWLFLLYWGGVATLVIFLFMLALLDLLAVRRRYRAELNRLRHEYKNELPPDENSH